MAALLAVPLGQPQHLPPGQVRVRVRALNPGRNTFWMRQVFVDNPPAGYVSVDDIMEAQPHLQDLLNTQLPCMAKVVMRVQLSEESFDPIDGEREVIFSERRFATVPMLVRPLADPGSVAMWLQEVEGLLRIVLSMLGSTTPSRARGHHRLADLH